MSKQETQEKGLNLLTKIKSFFYKKPQPKKISKWKIFLIIFSIFFIFSLSCTTAVFSYQQNFSQRIYNGVIVGPLDLGGYSLEQAKNILDTKAQKVNAGGINIVFNGKTVNVDVEVLDEDPELAGYIVKYDNEKTIKKAFDYGRNEGVAKNTINQIIALSFKMKLNPEIEINDKILSQAIKTALQDFEQPAQDAHLAYNSKTGKFEIIADKSGLVFDYDKIKQQIVTDLKNYESKPVIVYLQEQKPKITQADAAVYLEQAQNLANLAPLTLVYKDKKWTINKNEISDVLDFGYDNSQIVININKDKLNKLVKSKADKTVYVEAKDPLMEFKNGKLAIFQKAKSGQQIDIEKTYNNFVSQFLNNHGNQITLEVSEKVSQAVQDIDSLGIKELIGVGESNFAGSPSNRRVNIKVGARKLHGLLIKPGEEFSVNTAIGPVDGRTGFLQELVIKGNKTVPEYGGGLCQVGTTMFRAIINSGLPVLERRNHSYRVVYYEPAGTDATIYSPKPDLRFKNDTANYILVQTYVSGNKARFEFWGTKDGRKVTVSKPRIYNIRSAGPTKLIETTSLAPGVKKCTEKAHAGADASFTRKIEYANGEVKDETYNSHYVPWPAVCMIGKGTPAPAAPAATTTTPAATSATPAASSTTPAAFSPANP